MVTRKDFPAKSVPELVAYAKANPRVVNFGTTGSGTSVHLAMELLQIRAGIELVQVPYRGMAPAYNDLAGGHLDIEAVKFDIREMGDYLKSESKLWTEVIRTANIPAE